MSVTIASAGRQATPVRVLSLWKSILLFGVSRATTTQMKEFIKTMLLETMIDKHGDYRNLIYEFDVST
jgi:hypothetical protein